MSRMLIHFHKKGNSFHLEQCRKASAHVRVLITNLLYLHKPRVQVNVNVSLQCLAVKATNFPSWRMNIKVGK